MYFRKNSLKNFREQSQSREDFPEEFLVEHLVQFPKELIEEFPAELLEGLPEEFPEQFPKTKFREISARI